MKAIINTRLIMEDCIIWNGAITFQGNTIVSVGKAAEVEIPEGTEIIDAKGKYTAPGLIDIHNHGGDQYTFDQDPLECAKFFLKHGQTTVLPTFYQTLSLAQMLDAAKKIREAQKHPIGRVLKGIYMEGPYMSCDGSFKEEMKWGGPVVADDYLPLIRGTGDLVRVWAVDPSRENIEDFMAAARKENPNVIFALGHTDATASQCRKLKKLGVRVETHFGDTGHAPGRAQGTYGAGADEYTLYDPDIYAELICDAEGIHVVPDLIKMVVRAKGVEKMILITDHMVSPGDFKNDEAAGVAYGPDLNYDNMGRLAGSHLTLENACHNLMAHTGYGLCHAIRMATINPARMLGIDDVVGSLEPGKLANLIIIDDAVQVDTVVLEGDVVVANAEPLYV